MMNTKLGLSLAEARALRAAATFGYLTSSHHGAHKSGVAPSTWKKLALLKLTTPHADGLPATRKDMAARDGRRAFLTPKGRALAASICVLCVGLGTIAKGPDEGAPGSTTCPRCRGTGSEPWHPPVGELYVRTLRIAADPGYQKRELCVALAEPDRLGHVRHRTLAELADGRAKHVLASGLDCAHAELDERGESTVARTLASDDDLIAFLVAWDPPGAGAGQVSIGEWLNAVKAMSGLAESEWLRLHAMTVQAIHRGMSTGEESES